MRLVDSHCHLQDERIIKEAARLVNQAQAKGVAALVVCGSSPDDWEAVHQLARTFDSVIPFFGVHPWYVKDIPKDWFDQLNSYLDHYPSGIGEIGLDHAIKDRNDSEQLAVFTQQLELAKKRQLPVQIHCRQAWDVVPALLKKARLEKPAIMHSFSGSPEVMKQLESEPVYFSFSGSITRSGNKRAHRAVQAVPLERMLIETDAPDIPPVINHQLSDDVPNKPENLIYVLKQAAQLKMMTDDTLARQLWENSKQAFRSIRSI